MATIKYVVTKNVDELNSLQDKAIKAVVSARVQIQIALVATILHMGQHGDWKVAERLVEGLGSTVNGKAIVDFFQKYGNLVVSETGFVGFAEKNFKEAIAKTLDEAKATMWWTLKVPNPYGGFSLEQKLEQVIRESKAAQARAIKHPEDAPKIDVAVNEATIRTLLQICHFDAIFANAQQDNLVAGERLEAGLPA